MKPSSLFLPAAAALLAAVFCASFTRAQAPQSAPPAPAGAAPHPGHDFSHYVPTNLKVLPKDLNGEQIHKIMEGWSEALGAHCDTCHVAYPGSTGPNGRPRLNFADDSRPEKSTARIMYKMVEDINGNYISMVENSGAGVSCGTCHRGHLDPEPFVALPEHHGGPQMPPAAH